MTGRGIAPQWGSAGPPCPVPRARSWGRGEDRPEYHPGGRDLGLPPHPAGHQHSPSAPVPRAGSVPVHQNNTSAAPARWGKKPSTVPQSRWHGATVPVPQHRTPAQHQYASTVYPVQDQYRTSNPSARPVQDQYPSARPVRSTRTALVVGGAVPLPVPTHAGAPGPTESPPVGRGGGMDGR